jgi:hypothetical protein
MMSTQEITLNTLRKVQDFMTSNASALGTISHSSSRQALDELAATLRSHGVSQAGARSTRTTAVARLTVLRSALLVKYLRPISAIAEVQLSQSPDFTELKLPKGVRSTQQILNRAGAMGAAAARYADTFVKAGMSPTFLAELAAAANDLESAATAKARAFDSQKGATTGLTAVSKQARKIVRQLDALIEPVLAGNPALLAQWKSAKKFTGRAQPIASTTLSSAATTPVPVVSVPVAPVAATTNGTAQSVSDQHVAQS